MLAAAVLLTACASSGDGERRFDDEQTPLGGVRGVTDVDTGCSRTPGASTCPRRPISVRLRFLPQDGNAAEVHLRTGDDGRFSVDLPPGRYAVLPDDPSGRPFPRAEPLTVDVSRATFTTVTLRFDSGGR